MARSTLDEVWTRHVADSLQLLEHAPAGFREWVDLGSGAGFPGLVVAIACKGEPARHFTLVESNGKKAAFLRTAIRETGAHASVAAERIETHAGRMRGQADIVSARALAPLAELLKLGAPYLAEEGVMLLLKGQDAVQEIDAASQSFAFDVVDFAERDRFERMRSRHPQRPPEGAAMSSRDPLPARPRVLAIANQKGGVGKTTTAINLGTALAAIGETVLIVDLDPQGNASTGLGVERKPDALSTYDVLIGDASLADVASETAVPRLHIAPSTLDLLGVELEIAAMPDRNYRLRKATASVADATREPAFTYMLVDCPPSLNLLTINAMAAAHAVLVPLQCEFFALEGLSQILGTVERVALRPQSGACDPWHRAHHVRRTQQAVRPGGGRRARPSRRQGLQDGDPAQCARVGSAVARQAGASLRPEMRGQPGLSKLASEIIQRERTLRAA